MSSQGSQLITKVYKFDSYGLLDFWQALIHTTFLDFRDLLHQTQGAPMVLRQTLELPVGLEDVSFFLPQLLPFHAVIDIFLRPVHDAMESQGQPNICLPAHQDLVDDIASFGPGRIVAFRNHSQRSLPFGVVLVGHLDDLGVAEIGSCRNHAKDDKLFLLDILLDQFRRHFVDILHLASVVRHSRQVDQRELRALPAGHAYIQGFPGDEGVADCVLLREVLDLLLDGTHRTLLCICKGRIHGDQGMRLCYRGVRQHGQDARHARASVLSTWKLDP
mmetsp:Transcript_106138/g.269546  ORF Transcript_106138/g.269546 Transcript_106138/m.269546 type:complete len:275 (-) Transcript_106138:261-1085(-)